MQNMSLHLQLSEIVGTQDIGWGTGKMISNFKKITDHFACTSANVIYCITCTLSKKLYIIETGKRLGDRFRDTFAT